MLVIHTDEAREDQSFEIPYTSYSKRLPRTVVDTNGDETTYDNHFRVESDGKILLTID
ncbi:MAG: hypothetical protein LBU27_05865 [Candidatus Peribacteria bacterium]|jgi:hypothetical protein|nr:hypothetical protein [Candidatus Peribacteria bacterium]